MAGPLVQQGATVMCPHGGQANPTVPNTRVTVSGSPTSTIAAPWLVAGCPGIPAIPVPPCVTAQWTTGTTRVTSNGQPLVVQSSTGLTVPNGLPVIIVATQTRVTAI